MATPRIVDTLVELLQVESITGNEAPLARLVEERIRHRVPSAAVRRTGRSIVVSGPVVPGRPTIAFAGHLDTVPGTDTGDRVRVEGGRVIGLGASDMKSGLAVMLELLTPETLSRSRFNIVQVYYDGEEGPAATNGIHGVLKERNLLEGISLCFVLEPTNGTLHLGCMGGLHAEVSFRGRSAHSARPWEGENAIHKAGPLLSKLAALEPKIVMAGGLPFREVLSVTVANGGSTRNVVPDRFVLNLNYRFAPGRSVPEAIDTVRQFVGDGAEVSIVDEYPACPVFSDNPILREFRERFGLPEHPKQAYTDVAAFAEAGIPAVNFGPGLTSQCHQKDEYVMIEDLVSAEELLRRFLEEA